MIIIVFVTDLPNKLTFESIYNNTEYAQLQTLQKPYPTPASNHNYNQNENRFNRTGMNEIDISDLVHDKKGLLVGFSRDPFRYSVPEEDYSKGVR